ncbi:unnamed protein product [Caenorhabditis auriculariae]|uniref:Uncharacterized protein n=1 Tax=Caenorhabditis auriculariae TaxID=2777116 RepID=A0A8S1HAT2_9PELO|nr:unnamed protein product [Caenorhabditis auriculariae]
MWGDNEKPDRMLLGTQFGARHLLSPMGHHGHHSPFYGPMGHLGGRGAGPSSPAAADRALLFWKGDTTRRKRFERDIAQDVCEIAAIGERYCSRLPRGIALLSLRYSPQYWMDTLSKGNISFFMVIVFWTFHKDRSADQILHANDVKEKQIAHSINNLLKCVVVVVLYCGK